MLKGHGSGWHSDNLRVRLLFVPGGDIRSIALVGVPGKFVGTTTEIDTEGRPSRYLKGGADIAKWSSPLKRKRGFAFRFKPGNR
jgi:hypothetical protein